MAAQKAQSTGWPVKAAEAPKIADAEWALAAVPGIILFVAAVLQLISFSDFKDALGLSGIAGPTVWAVCIIVAELWGAAGFFKLRLSLGFRYVSYTMAILASGFWFVYNLQLAAGSLGAQMQNSNFFGRFLAQSPSWWTVIEVTVLLFWVVYKVGLLRDNQRTTARR